MPGRPHRAVGEDDGVGAMLVIVSLPSASLAPPELRTASDGMILACPPIVFCAGAVIASWASAGPDTHSRLSSGC